MALRPLTVNGRKGTFNKEAFKYLIKQKNRKEKISISEIERQLSEVVEVSQDAVHKWNGSGGGPMDGDTVVDLAHALGCDVSLLMNYTDGGTEMEKLTDRQKTAAKRIYDSCILFLNKFEHTDGFNDLWIQFKDAGSTNPEMDIYDYAEDKINEIMLILDQEYFDLHDCTIYDELCEFVNEDLRDTFDGKCSYAYRFEAEPNGNPTTSDAYNKAMIRLNGIIEKHV